MATCWRARAVLAQPALRGAVLTVLVGSLLCSPLLTFCPVLVKTVFQADVAQFSLTERLRRGRPAGRAAADGGGPARDRRPLASWAASGFAAVVLLSALNPGLGPAAAVRAGGLAMTAANASANAWLQSQAPAAIRGQTVSLFMLAMRGGTALGGLLTGLTVSAWGCARRWRSTACWRCWPWRWCGGLAAGQAPAQWPDTGMAFRSRRADGQTVSRGDRRAPAPPVRGLAGRRTLIISAPQPHRETVVRAVPPLPGTWPCQSSSWSKPPRR
jgi:hypothetical protein